ncbi:RNA-binding protein, predicted, partial [Enterocytozoon bieneusi H348]
MKQKFSVLDVAAVTNELRVILKNKYVVNFYSHKQRLFYFKFSSKDILAIEPGVRLNLTLDHESEINHFCKKLRETCRNLRVVDIYQLGFDRIVMVDLYRYRIVLEFYSLGNIIILDRNDMIVEIQRPIEQLSMVKGQKYVWNNVRLVFSPDDFVSIETFCKNVPFENEFGKKMINEYMRTHGIKFENMSDAMRIKEFEEYVRSQICELKWYGEIVFKKGKKSEFKCFNIETSPDLSKSKT